MLKKRSWLSLKYIRLEDRGKPQNPDNEAEILPAPLRPSLAFVLVHLRMT